MPLKDIVDVQITREDTPISRIGFGTPLVLGLHKVFNERVQTYTDLDSMITAGFIDTDPEYLAAEKFFSQSPRVEQVDIGRRTIDGTKVEVTTAIDDTDYWTKINGIIFQINSGAGATPISIASALVIAINGGTEPVTAIDNTDGTYNLNANVAGTAYSLFVDTNQTIQAYTPTDSITDDIVAVRAENDDWYLITETRHDVTEVVELAGYIETTEKLFFTTSDNLDIIDKTEIADTTSLPVLIKAANYDRTIVCYHEPSSTIPPIIEGGPTEFEAAFAGVGLPKDPGSITWAFKTLNGITASSLNKNQIRNALAKNCNVYVEVAGVDITRDGKVGSGEYIDIMRGIDWLTQRIRENVFSAFINADKIPYTNGGIRIIDSHLRATLTEGVAAKFLLDFSTHAPKLADIDPNDKAQRILKNVTFKATPTDAIHKVEIRGEVSIF